MISQWFAGVDQGEKFPPVRAMASSLAMPLRYGENPHQEAALYLPMGPAAPGIDQARQVQGTELSYHHLNAPEPALELVSEFRDGRPTVVIVTNPYPCGVAPPNTLLWSYPQALQGQT